MTRILFDLDGTCNKFYDEPNWLEDLNNERTRPYLNAAPMEDIAVLNGILAALQAMGHDVRVCSWCAMGATREYDKAVRRAKKRWLAKHLPSIDRTHIVRYGTPKKEFGYGCEAILFDDDEKVREEFEGTGKDGNTRTAYAPEDIFKVCAGLLSKALEVYND